MPTRVKREHEFRDPIHNFISLDRQRRALVDSEPFQRLRHIHQLALTYLVYPGASHKRFEHSLGVMHLAAQVFDIVTDPKNRHPETEHIFPDNDHLKQWRTALCLAALCHDIGHLPFSHAAEKEILPDGEDHESLTLALIDSDALSAIWSAGAHINKDHVKKLSVGSKKYKGGNFSDWEAILSEIITGDSFGVDRIDYLLRDSYHLGVSYGRFDHAKLIESLRVLPRSGSDEGSKEPALGVEIGGLHSAEALLLARYFMYEQVYFHHVRRIYDRHLIDFMKQHYGTGGYKFDPAFHLTQTDSEVLAAMRRATLDLDAPGSAAARAVLQRGHYRRVYSKNPTDDALAEQSLASAKLSPTPQQADLSAAYFLKEGLTNEFGAENIFYDRYVQKSNPSTFPVLMEDGRIEISTELSSVLRNIPLTNVAYIFVAPNMLANASEWIAANRASVLTGAPQ